MGYAKYCECGCKSIILTEHKKSRFLPGHQNRHKFIVKANCNETIFCQCGCNEQLSWKSKYIYNGWPKYKNYHFNKIKTQEYIIQNKKRIEKLKLEIHICKCGCNKQINWINDYKNKGWPEYIKGHLIRAKGKIMAMPNDIKYCKCGCNKQILYRQEFRYKGWPDYINKHHMNIPKNILYGSLENFSKINEKISNTLKGKKKPEGFGQHNHINKDKTNIQRLGKEKTINVKLKQSVYKSRPTEITWGKETSDKFKQKQRDRLLGKTWSELYDKKTVKKMYKSLDNRGWWGEGIQEKIYFDNFDKINNCQIERHKVIWLPNFESPFFIDGYYNNEYYEFFEPYHRYKQKIIDYKKFLNMIKLNMFPIKIIYNNDWKTYHHKIPDIFNIFIINNQQDLDNFYNNVYT